MKALWGHSQFFINQGNGDSRSPRYSKTVTSTGKLCPKMYHKKMEIGKSLVLLLTVDTVYQHKLAGLHQAVQHMWIWHVEPSSTSPVVTYHGTVCQGITTIHAGGVQMVWRNTVKMQVPVQMRAEMSPANLEEEPSKLSNPALPPASTQPLLPKFS